MKISCQTGIDVEVQTDSLENFCLDGLDLHRALLEGVNIKGASFKKADIRNALFIGADAEGVNMSEARAMNAYFMNAKMRGSSFVNARPICALFDNADLTNADFSGADIGGARFIGARLHGAIMLCKRLEQANLTGAIYDRNTRWPLNFNPEISGAILDEK